MAVKESVVRLPSQGEDRFGDPLPAGAPETITGVVVYPRSSRENTDAANMVIDQLGMLLPPGAIVSPDDRFRVRGKEYNVEGQPYDTKKRGTVVSLTGVVQGG